MWCLIEVFIDPWLELGVRGVPLRQEQREYVITLVCTSSKDPGFSPDNLV